MNPIRIEIANMGAVTHADHDLSHMDLAVVAGPNGAGKSTTFTIAPVWTLYGITKNGCSVDDMITTGQTDMCGIQEFEHQGSVYRVVRTRSKKTKQGKSSLELFRQCEGEWVSESGTSIQETQAKIRALLGLDAETFTASSMILQGKANEFSSKTPAERKRTLQEILGLRIYDELQAQARMKYAQRTAQLEQFKGRLAELKNQMGDANKESLQAALADTQTAIALYEAEIKTTEHQLQEAVVMVAGIQAKETRAKDLDNQAGTLEEEIAERQQTIKEEKSAIAQEESLLLEADDIREKAAKFDEIRIQVADLENKQATARTIEAEYNAAVETRRNQQDKADKLTPQIADLEQLLKQRSQLENDAQAYRQAEARLEELNKLLQEYTEQDNKLRKAQDAYDVAVRNQTANIKVMTGSIEVLRGKTVMLNNSGCVDPDNATCKFLKDAQEAKQQLPDKEKDLADYREVSTQEIANLKTLVDQALNARTAIGYDHQEHSKVAEQVRTFKPSVDKLAQLEAKAELLENLRTQQAEYLQAAQDTDKQAQEKWTALDKVRGELLQLEAQAARLPELREYADLLPKLNNAQAAIDASNQRISSLQNEINNRQGLATTKRHEAETIRTELAQIEQIDLEAIKSALSTARELLKTGEASKVRLQAELDKVTGCEAEHAKVTAAMVPLSKEIVRWQTLIRAFGRDGVPAMIIECAVPELESIANEILGQMTRGKNALFFNTQRDKKDGKGILETLDIMITDWECPQGRPYETFSGGEQLRIDFALRFALAELLARRAGSRVEWLTIDEGLGSQDKEHRDLVLEAIRNVSDRFKKVILITHVEEAQAAFDECIYIER